MRHALEHRTATPIERLPFGAQECFPSEARKWIMTKSYSLDLRVRVVAFVEASHSCQAVARHFGVSNSFAIKLLQRQRQSGSPTPARQGRPPDHRRLSPYETFLIQAVETKPDIAMPELAARLLE